MVDSQQFTPRPNMFADPCLHRPSYFKALMNPNEIVVEEMQGQCRFEVLKFPRERIRQPCKPTHLHSHSQVLSLNVSCQDVLPNRLPDQCFDQNST